MTIESTIESESKIYQVSVTNENGKQELYIDTYIPITEVMDLCTRCFGYSNFYIERYTGEKSREEIIDQYGLYLTGFSPCQGTNVLLGPITK